jgi:outer membrane receptor protein involved in Fe transport
MQFNQSKLESYTSEGKGLVADALNTVGAAATKNADQDLINQNSLGFYVQEQVGWRERLYVTGAVRVDNNSAFGDEIKLVTYPKASVAYVISDESFFRLPYVNQLKLRAAWGEAGNAPAPFSATRAYEPTVTTQGDIAVNQVRTSTYGNPNLKAETGSEIELGFDASLLNGRAGIEVTYYDKTTKDALVTVPAPPSTGFIGTYLSNIGEIKNAGLEVAINGTPISGRNFSWDARMTFATNANKLVSFGADINEIFFGEFANVQKHKAGYPLGGVWASDVQRDASGKPVLDANGKVIPQLATNHYVGSSLPTREMSLTNTLTLPGNFRVYGYLDYKGGYYGWEALWSVRDRLDRNTFEVANPNADPVQVQVLQSGVTAPYINRADFVKLRELSLTYTLPQVVLRHAGLKGASVIVSGRNLAIWKLKNYRGMDPEVNFANQTSTNGQFYRTDYGSVPMLRRIVTSLNLTF